MNRKALKIAEVLSTAVRRPFESLQAEKSSARLSVRTGSTKEAASPTSRTVYTPDNERDRMAVVRMGNAEGGDS
jgi:hypothetical protein